MPVNDPFCYWRKRGRRGRTGAGGGGGGARNVIETNFVEICAQSFTTLFKLMEFFAK